MIRDHETEARRRAAIAKLAEVSKHLQASAEAVTNRLVRLASDDYASPQKAIASLAVYQQSGLLCAEEMQEAEALLRGEPIQETAERNRQRAERLAMQEVRHNLGAEGFIEVPGDTERAKMTARLVIFELSRMSEAELSDLYDDLDGRRRSKPRCRRAGQRRKVKAPASPFRVIEGGGNA